MSADRSQEAQRLGEEIKKLMFDAEPGTGWLGRALLLVDQLTALASQDSMAELVAWKLGNEFAPFHPDASHISPDYRDGWNACYRASLASAPSAPEGLSNEQIRTLGKEAFGIDIAFDGHLMSFARAIEAAHGIAAAQIGATHE